MRGLRSHQSLAAPEHLQFWAPLIASVCITCGYRRWWSFPLSPFSLKGQQTERISVVFLSHVLLHHSPVCDSTLSVMKENYFLWKCLFFFFPEQANETLHSLEARRSHGNSTFPLWFPFFSISISTLTLPLSLCHSLIFFSHFFAHCSPLPHILLSSFSSWYFISDLLKYLLFGCFLG